MYSTYQIFEPKQHYLTTVYRNRNRNAKRIRVKSVDQLERLVDNQPKDSDLYITKYGKDGVVWNIILDFDSEDDKGVAWMDCLVLSQFRERKGIRCVIVDSTNKGYHLYVLKQGTPWRVSRNWKKVRNIFTLIVSATFPYGTLSPRGFHPRSLLICLSATASFRFLRACSTTSWTSVPATGNLCLLPRKAPG